MLEEYVVDFAMFVLVVHTVMTLLNSVIARLSEKNYRFFQKYQLQSSMINCDPKCRYALPVFTGRVLAIKMRDNLNCVKSTVNC